MLKKICLGEIVAAQGIKGQVRIKTFTQKAENIQIYGPLSDLNGNNFIIKVCGIRSYNLVIAEIKGCINRNQAEAMVGLKLYVDSACMPNLDLGEFYYNALVGMKVMSYEKALIF